MLWASRLVDQVQKLVVLPEADAERDHHGEQGNDQARAQLVEVVHDAQLRVVAYGSNPGSEYVFGICVGGVLGDQPELKLGGRLDRAAGGIRRHG